ncbi:MAG: hypothetical protein ACREJM_15420, partial [Candidatus Saccharimonadales bacterium]
SNTEADHQADADRAQSKSDADAALTQATDDATAQDVYQQADADAIETWRLALVTAETKFFAAGAQAEVDVANGASETDWEAEYNAADAARTTAVDLARQAYFASEAGADATQSDALESDQLAADTTTENAQVAWTVFGDAATEGYVHDTALAADQQTQFDAPATSAHAQYLADGYASAMASFDSAHPSPWADLHKALAAATQAQTDLVAPALSVEQIAFADADFVESVGEAQAQQGLDDAQASDAVALSLAQEGAQVGLDAAQAQFNSAIAAFAAGSSSTDLLPAQLVPVAYADGVSSASTQPAQTGFYSGDADFNANYTNNTANGYNNYRYFDDNYYGYGYYAYYGYGAYYGGYYGYWGGYYGNYYSPYDPVGDAVAASGLPYGYAYAYGWAPYGYGYGGYAYAYGGYGYGYWGGYGYAGYGSGEQGLTSNTDFGQWGDYEFRDGNAYNSQNQSVWWYGYDGWGGWGWGGWGGWGGYGWNGYGWGGGYGGYVSADNGWDAYYSGDSGYWNGPYGYWNGYGYAGYGYGGYGYAGYGLWNGFGYALNPLNPNDANAVALSLYAPTTLDFNGVQIGAVSTIGSDSGAQAVAQHVRSPEASFWPTTPPADTNSLP